MIARPVNSLIVGVKIFYIENISSTQHIFAQYHCWYYCLQLTAANHTPASGIQCHGFCHSSGCGGGSLQHRLLGSAIFAIATNCTVSWLQGRGASTAIWSRNNIVIATIVICKCLGICLPSPGLILVFNMTSIKYLQACQAPSVYYLPAMSFSNSDGLKTNNTR